MLQMAFGWTHFVFPSCSLVNKLSAQIAEPCVLCQRRGKKQIPFVRLDSLCQTLSQCFSTFFCSDPYELSWGGTGLCIDASSPCSDNHIAFLSLPTYSIHLTVRSVGHILGNSLPSNWTMCIWNFTSSFKKTKQNNKTEVVAFSQYISPLPK